MSKFQSPLAEAAHIIANNGFADYEVGDITTDGHFDALVCVSRVTLMNMGAEQDLIDAFTATEGVPHDGDISIWITEDSQGFVDVVEFGEHKRVEDAFLAAHPEED